MDKNNDTILRLAEKLIETGKEENIAHACKLLETHMEHELRKYESELRHNVQHALNNNPYRDLLDYAVSGLSKLAAQAEAVSSVSEKPAQVIVRNVLPPSTPAFKPTPASNSRG